MLEAATADTVEEAGTGLIPVICGTLHREGAGAARLLTALARVFVSGADVNWAAVLPAGHRVDLPTYAFQRQQYWPDPTAGPVPAGSGGAGEAGFWAAVEDCDLQALTGALAVDGEQSLRDVLPALAAWRRRERDRSVIGEWRYQVSWMPVPEPDPVPLPGTWLVVAPAGHTRDLADCEHALTGRGADVVTIQADPAASRADLAARLAGFRPRGVLSLLALDENPAAFDPVVPAGLAGTLTLIQALGDVGIGAPLWVLTRAAVTTGTEPLTSPVQAQAWGLGRVAAAEHPDRWGGLIDLPPVLDAKAAARLCAVLAGTGEDQVAIRPAGIMARRLVRAPHARPARPWTPRGTMLITGGTGAIGARVARWASGRHAPRIMLTSRTGPLASGAATLAAGLAARGTAVDVLACDTARRADVIGVLGWLAEAGAPLVSTVMHAAGVLDDGVLDGMTPARLATVLGGKAAGAAHLDELTADLDAFVLFSSAAGVLGRAAQGNYAAANAYLDALAHSRHARGLPAISIAWGPWGGGGVAEANDAVQDRMRRGALPEMDPDLAVRALAQALDGGDAVLAVMDVDWAQFAAAAGLIQAPFLRDLPDLRALRVGSGEAAASPDRVPDGELSRRLAGVSAAEQARLLTDLVRSKTAAVLGHASAAEIDPGRAFSGARLRLAERAWRCGRR